MGQKKSGNPYFSGPIRCLKTRDSNFEFLKRSKTLVLKYTSLSQDDEKMNFLYNAVEILIQVSRKKRVTELKNKCYKSVHVDFYVKIFRDKSRCRSRRGRSQIRGSTDL